MSEFVLTPRARADLDEIWAYTEQRWGEKKAAAYIKMIGQACEKLAAHPTMGRPCDHIRMGLCRSKVGSHILFYRIRIASVVVVRILHERMDFAQHL